MFGVFQKDEQSDRERWQHLADLADFALAMKVTLMNINYQSFNNFMLRIGESQSYSYCSSMKYSQFLTFFFTICGSFILNRTLSFCPSKFCTKHPIITTLKSF